jgi:hypothetical protein
MDDQSVNPIVCPSSGIHIVLPDYYSPERMGLLDPVMVPADLSSEKRLLCIETRE